MASSFVQRRLWTLAAVVVATGAGLWGAYAFDQRARAREARAADAERIFRCSPAVLSMRLSATPAAGERVAPIEVSRAPQAAASNPDGGNATVNDLNDLNERPWRLVSPVQALADAHTTSALLDAACALKRSSQIKAKPGEPPLSLLSFGLEPPRRLLTLRLADGSEQTLAIGERSGFNDSLYVQAGGQQGPPSVDVVDGGFAFQVERDAFSLRDKRLLTFPTRDVAAAEVCVKGRRAFAIARDANGRWTLAGGADAKGAATPADDHAVGAWLDALVSMRAKQFVDEAPEAARLGHFGLAEPAYALRFTGNANQALGTLRLGALTIANEPHLFAQSGPARAPVAEIEGPSITDKLADGGAALRDLRLVHVDPAAVERVVITEGARTLVLGRPDGRPHGWQVEGDANAVVAASKVDGLVYRLAHLRADTLASDVADADSLQAAGLASPALIVELQGTDARPLASLRIGSAVAERRSAVGDGGQLAQIFAQAADGASADPNDFLDN